MQTAVRATDCEAAVGIGSILNSGQLPVNLTKVNQTSYQLPKFSAQSLINVPQDIVNMLNTNRQTNQVGPDAGSYLLFFIQLAVCG